MKTIDIRDDIKGDVTEIRFASGGGGMSEFWMICRDSDGDICTLFDYVQVNQIDNLIKALKKAKELWGRF